MSTRVITLFSTKGGKQKLNTDVTTWGELKLLVEEYYDLVNLQAVENITKTTLDHPEAVLPEGNFVLFLRPINTKGGIRKPSYSIQDLEFSELRALVTTDEIKEHLNKQTPGKNWTQLGTEELRKGLASYTPEPDNQKENPIANIGQVEQLMVNLSILNNLLVSVYKDVEKTRYYLKDFTLPKSIEEDENEELRAELEELEENFGPR